MTYIMKLSTVARRMAEETYGANLLQRMSDARKEEIIVAQAASVSALASVLKVDVEDILALASDKGKVRR